MSATGLLNTRLCSVLVVSITTIFFSASCSSKNAEQAEIDRITNQMRARAALMEKQRYVNENWNADCTVDNVSTVRRCYAGTFGQRLGYDGEPFGSKSIPFQVVYIDRSGPFIRVGYHTYPGRHPTVRIDDHAPVSVQDDGGVTAPSADPLIVQQMLSGRTARAAYHVWPQGEEQMYVDLSGFDQAWQRLNVIKK